jgi:hypothetical protein
LEDRWDSCGVEVELEVGAVLTESLLVRIAEDVRGRNKDGVWCEREAGDKAASLTENPA